MKRITVVGAGFAGLSAIRRLRAQDPAAELTLVSPRPELHFLPGIIWIPSGLRKREAYSEPDLTVRDAQRTEQLVVQMQRRIERLGYKVTLEPQTLVGA